MPCCQHPVGGDQRAGAAYITPAVVDLRNERELVPIRDVLSANDVFWAARTRAVLAHGNSTEQDQQHGILHGPFHLPILPRPPRSRTTEKQVRLSPMVLCLRRMGE